MLQLHFAVIGMNKGQIIGLIGGIIALIGFFLPWVIVSATNPDTGQQISVGVPGYLTVMAFGFTPLIFSILVIIFAGVIKKPIGGILVLVFALLGLILTGLAFGAVEYIKAMYAGYENISAETGAGLYLTLVGFIIGFVGGIMHFIMAKKEAETSAPTAKTQTPPS